MAPPSSSSSASSSPPASPPPPRSSSPESAPGSPSPQSDVSSPVAPAHSTTPPMSINRHGNPMMTVAADATPFEFTFDFQSPVAGHHARMPSPFMLATPSSKRHAGALAMPVSCTFEALSLHFHLPLKVAAEKFGVRATAFKKRCRAIGIRHWPYRKVRSLKRSLQDLARCKDEGALSDKQTNQLASYQKQLDKLLSPETYGIDPTSGRLLAAFQVNDDDDGENDSDNCDEDCDSCGSQSSSSRVGSPYSASCSGVRASYKPRGGRGGAQRSMRGRQPMGHANPATTHFFYNMVHGGNANDYLDSPSVNDAATMPSVSVRFAAHSALHASSGIPFEAYDPFFSDFKGGEYSLTMEDFGDDDHPTCGYALDGISTSVHDDDFFPMIRSPTMAPARRALLSNDDSELQHQAQPLQHQQSQHLEAEGLEDDVFLQISPDFGCLV
ncbi:hypothetical protein Gpo141_00000307 [Globisporangium polare]